MCKNSCGNCEFGCYQEWGPTRYADGSGEPGGSDFDCRYLDEIDDAVHDKSAEMSIDEAMEYIAAFCLHYYPEIVRCVKCDANMGAVHKVSRENWVSALYGDPIPVCDTHLAGARAQFEKDRREYDEIFDL